MMTGGSTLLTVGMATMMVLMMGGMLVGACWAIFRRRGDGRGR